MNKLFAVHMLNATGKSKARDIALAFDRLAEELAVLCPTSRELSIAYTKLEEAAFFAKKAMASNSINGEETSQ